MTCFTTTLDKMGNFSRLSDTNVQFQNPWEDWQNFFHGLHIAYHYLHQKLFGNVSQIMQILTTVTIKLKTQVTYYSHLPHEKLSNANCRYQTLPALCNCTAH